MLRLIQALQPAQQGVIHEIFSADSLALQRCRMGDIQLESKPQPKSHKSYLNI